MKNRLIFILSIIGILVSGYLLQRYVSGGPIICGLSAGCETVRASPYAYVWHVPLPAFGLLFYLMVFGTSFLLVAQPKRDKVIRGLLLAESAAGVLVSFYLFGLEVFVIHAVCLWCTVSGLVSIGLFLLAVSLLKSDNGTVTDELRN